MIVVKMFFFVDLLLCYAGVVGEVFISRKICKTCKYC